MPFIRIIYVMYNLFLQIYCMKTINGIHKKKLTVKKMWLNNVIANIAQIWSNTNTGQKSGAAKKKQEVN
jgi:hypothetical protein